MSHKHDSSAGSQNLGNSIGSRPAVRQSRLYRIHESGNNIKGLLGQSELCWDTRRKEGAYSGPVYDHEADGVSAALGGGGDALDTERARVEARRQAEARREAEAEAQAHAQAHAQAQARYEAEARAQIEAEAQAIARARQIAEAEARHERAVRAALEADSRYRATVAQKAEYEDAMQSMVAQVDAGRRQPSAQSQRQAQAQAQAPPPAHPQVDEAPAAGVRTNARLPDSPSRKSARHYEKYPVASYGPGSAPFGNSANRDERPQQVPERPGGFGSARAPFALQEGGGGGGGGVVAAAPPSSKKQMPPRKQRPAPFATDGEPAAPPRAPVPRARSDWAWNSASSDVPWSQMESGTLSPGALRRRSNAKLDSRLQGTGSQVVSGWATSNSAYGS